MKTIALIALGFMLSFVSLKAQNVKIQTNGKSGKTQVKVKETPAPVSNVQIKSNPGGTQVKIHSNPSGVKVQIKEHPPKGRKK
ncbi:MAG: hypothetical protein KatS3mg027_0153 [Bacteroidia bacterium]|nr:MAG: hypothetical protein KatS3mg027_0153 [Bacteroidia bacterium]